MKFPSGKKLIALLLVLSTVVTLSYPVSSQATDVITDLQNETQELENQISGINEEILKVGAELTDLNRQIELTQGEVKRTEDELEKAIENQEKQYDEMTLRIQFMYENGDASLLELIFEAESLADFVNKTEFVSSVQEYDQDQLDQLLAIQETIESEKENLKAEEEALERLQEESKAKEAELKKQAEDASLTLAQVQEQLRVEEEKKRAEEEAARLAAEEAARKAAEEAASSNVNGGTTTTKPYEGNASELDVFAAILDCEAAADYNSRLAVATVIMNRVHSGSFPNTVSDVIYAPGQFSPVWTGKLDKTLANGASQLSYQVAQAAMNGERLASVSHCYYFLYAGSTNREGVNVGGNLFFASW